MLTENGGFDKRETAACCGIHGKLWTVLVVYSIFNHIMEHGLSHSVRTNIVP
jgi:hypothetical protein